MKFSQNGPDIPFELIKALEDDKLVFFCGAGVSFFEKKPEFASFPTLLRKVVEELNYTDESIFKFEVEAAFTVLEQKLGKASVENCIRRLLTLNGSSSEVLPQHQTVLRLSHCINRPIPRLVTTNFDNCFDNAWRNEAPVICHSASAIPVPGNNWSSIVHLHGKADVSHSELVYSSTSFASAYLGKGWARNFLMELFQEYTVVFLGYSMQDPIMRYGVQAQRIERRPYIFIPKVETESVTNLNLQVIPFEDYTGLWETLNMWAGMHEQGRDGWITYARTELLNAFPTGQEMAPESEVAIKNLTEILSDPHRANALSGNLPIDWLEIFRKIDQEPEKYHYFNVLQPANNSNPPCSYGRIVNSFFDTRPLHPVTRAIGDWLVRNIDKSTVLDYIVENGCLIHPEFTYGFKQAFKDQVNNGLISTAQQQAWDLILYHITPRPSRMDSVGLRDFDLLDGALQNSDKLFLIEQLRPRLCIKKSVTQYTEAESANGLLDIDIKISAPSGSKVTVIGEGGLLKQIQAQCPDILTSIFDAVEAYLQSVVRLSSLFQREELLNIRQNLRTKSDSHASEDWTVLLHWFWAAFDTLRAYEKQRWIEYWAQSSSLLIRRISLQAFNRLQES